MPGTTRRQFVRTILGSSVALGGCKKRSWSQARQAIPDGQLLTPGKQAGHRLRDHPINFSLSSPTAWLRAQVAIVGAGVAGLAAAWWLRRHGVENIVVLDLDSSPGGTAQAGQSSVTPYPWGAHYIVAPTRRQTELIQLMTEAGALTSATLDPQTTARLSASATCPRPEERIFHAGRWHQGLYLHEGASREDLRQYRAFSEAINQWVEFRDSHGKRAFDLPAASGSKAQHILALDKLSFGTWLDRQGLNSPRLRWLTNYACRDDYGLLDSDTSAWAGIFYFASRMNSADSDTRPVATWPQGNARLVEQMAQGLGSRLKLEHTVSDLRETQGGVQLLARNRNSSVGIQATRVILATPRFMTERLVSGLKQQAPPLVKRDRGAWAVANLHLSDPPRSSAEQCPLAWDNVLRDSRSLGYVVANHRRPLDKSNSNPAPTRPTVITWYYPFTGKGSEARRTLDSASREDWASAALNDIAQAHPEIHSLCGRIDVAYWGHGMVRPRPGHIFSEVLQGQSQAVGALHFANTDLSGVALFEEAFAHGVRAAGEVLAALQQGRLATP